LPDGWIWCKLGDITLFVATGPFGSMLHKSDYVENGIPLVNPVNMRNGIAVASDKMVVDDATKNRLNRYILRTNDIVIARRGDLGRCAVITENEDGWLCGTGSFFLHLASPIYIQYFTLFFTSPVCRSQLMGESVGSTMNNLNHNILNNVGFPLPPFEEQQRIVAKIDELMALCDELELVEKELDTLEDYFVEFLPKSILQAAVQDKLVPQNIHVELAEELLKRIQDEKKRLIRDGRVKKEKPLPPISEDEIPYDLPEGWVWCRLSDIGEIVGGATPSSTDPSYYTEPSTGIAWITPADMKNTKNNLIGRGKKDITIAGFDSCSTKLLPERLGWRFIRISGSEYYLDPKGAIARIKRDLNGYGIFPEIAGEANKEAGDKLLGRVKTRASQLIAEWQNSREVVDIETGFPSETAVSASQNR